MQPYTYTPWFDTSSTRNPVAPTKLTGAEVTVVGAGLAGCSIAWRLYQAGWRVTLVDMASTPASRASANPRAVLKPHLSRDAVSINAFYELAFKLTNDRLHWLNNSGFNVEKNQSGALQLFNRAGSWPEFSIAEPVNEQVASDIAEIPLRSPALYFPDGGWVNSASFCNALRDSCSNINIVMDTKITSLQRRREKWLLTCNLHNNSISRFYPDNHNQTHVLETHNVILATGSSMNELVREAIPILPLGLTNSAGQTTLCRYKPGAQRPAVVISAKRYVIPEAEQCTVGATHWRDRSDKLPVPGDDVENLFSLSHINDNLREGLESVGHWREVRSGTIDRLPLVGPVPDTGFYQNAYHNIKHGPKHQTFEAAQYIPGLYLLGGLGSRGMSSATLCAEILSTMMTDNDPFPRPATNKLTSFHSLVHPARFLIRQLIQGKNTT